MDTSEKYTDMCRKAVEIQKQKPSSTYFKPYFYCTKHNCLLDANSELEYQWCGSWKDWHDAKEDYVIWLPTLAELYNLHTPSDSKGYSAYGLARLFGIWLYARRDYTHEQEFDSIEQYLLAFVMWDVFGKHWNESEWELI